MKILKIFLVVLLVIIILVVVGGYFFMKTFDLNRYKDEIARRIGEPLGTNVEIEQMKLDFSFKKGVLLNISGVELDDRGVLSGMGVDIEEIELAFNISKFLSDREVVITNVFLREPIISVDPSVLKEKNNQDKVMPENNFSKNIDNAQEQGGTSEQIKNFSVSVDSIHIENGEVIVKADQENFMEDINVKEIEMTVNGLRLEQAGSQDESPFIDEPFTFTLSFSVFGAKEALSLKGEGWLDLTERQVRLDDVVAESDLSKLSLKTIAETFPRIQEMDLDKLRGNFKSTISQMIVNPSGVPVLSLNGSLTDGAVDTSLIPSGISKANLYAEYSGNNLDILESAFQIGSGKISFKGRVEDVLAAKLFNLELAVSDILLEQVIPEVNPEIDFAGNLNGTASIKGAGFLIPDLIRNTQAQAGFIIREGRIENFNVLSFVFNKISVIPALGEAFIQALPESYKSNINVDETVFDNVEVDATVENGVLSYLVTAVADIAEINVKGTLDWKNMLLFNGDLLLPQKASDELIEEFQAFSVLKDSTSGKIVIPFATYRGSLAGFRPTPDVEFLAKTIIRSKAKEKIGDALRDILDDGKGENGKSNINDAIGDIFGIKHPKNNDKQQLDELNGQQNLKEPEPDIIDTIFDSIFKK